MRRGLPGTVPWILLAAGIGVGLFFLKHEVKGQERRLHALNEEILQEQESIHVLRAEWSYLNDPTRLRALAEKHLSMHAVKAAEVAALDSVLSDGLPGGVTMAAAIPPRPPVTVGPPGVLPGAKAPAEKPRAVRLAEGPPKPKANDNSQRQPSPKPQAPKPGTVTMAKAPAAPVPGAAPARGGHLLTIRSPALAQNPQGEEAGR